MAGASKVGQTAAYQNNLIKRVVKIKKQKQIFAKFYYTAKASFLKYQKPFLTCRV
jgi:hypothetical protein